MSALEIDGLQAGYSGSNVLNGVSLTVAPGEIVALLGRNGMGKSTLANVIAGTHRHTGGSIELNSASASGWSPMRRFRAGLRTVRQERPVIASLSVRENLALAGVKDLGDSPFPFLNERADQDAGTLSGGEQKLLAVARITANPGTTWVLDEPTEGLQPSNVDRCGSLIQDAAKQGAGVLLIEQHLGLALRIAHRFYVLEKGAVIDEGTVDAHTLSRVTAHLSV